MAKVYIDESILEAIAEAIRDMGGASGTLLPSEMPQAIRSIGSTQTQTE